MKTISLPIYRTRWVRVLVVVVASLMTGLAGAGYMRVVAGGSGLNAIEFLGAMLFCVLFGWIAFSFALATTGWLALARKRHASERRDQGTAPAAGLDHRTAVLMPVYNESPERVFAGIHAMLDSLQAAGVGDAFDFYVLSDTTDSEVWLSEERAWSRLRSANPEARVFYRHRPKNVARKAGNIADFCTRWGSHYRYMIVLDADSLVEGETMAELVRRMDADDRLGILQVPPVPIGRQSLFARVQQFAAAAYSPIFVEGFAAWAGSDGNYWGHNAILRVEPFLEHCDLPVLPGTAPLGGEILSHDFVEAALMLKHGWKVELATDLGGSYEECPPTLTDYAKRDARWCQGNLQHARLVVSEGFRPLSRFHFASGVMAYVASPLWIAFTVACVLGMIVDRMLLDPETVVAPPTGIYPLADSLVLFVVSMALLLLPKLWSVLAILGDARRRRQFGGAGRVIGGAAVETTLSVLMSPIMAIFHSRFVVSTLTGKKVVWSAQQRDESGVGWRDALVSFWPMTVFGLAVAGTVTIAAPSMLVWFAPMVLGLILSIPLAVLLGSTTAGRALARLGCLLVPEEITPPRITQVQRLALEQFSPATGMFERVIDDPDFHHLHTHIVRSTDAGESLSDVDRGLIESAFATGGSSGIPAELRTRLLADVETLRSLHVESQLA